MAVKTVEERLHSALAHELRTRILVYMKQHGETSSSDLQSLLDEPLGVVSYHMRMLRDYKLVELTRMEPRRGALKHFYVLTDLGLRAAMVATEVREMMAS